MFGKRNSLISSLVKGNKCIEVFPRDWLIVSLFPFLFSFFFIVAGHYTGYNLFTASFVTNLKEKKMLYWCFSLCFMSIGKCWYVYRPNRHWCVLAYHFLLFNPSPSYCIYQRVLYYMLAFSVECSWVLYSLSPYTLDFYL